MKFDIVRKGQVYLVVYANQHTDIICDNSGKGYQSEREAFKKFTEKQEYSLYPFKPVSRLLKFKKIKKEVNKVNGNRK